MPNVLVAWRVAVKRRAGRVPQLAEPDPARIAETEKYAHVTFFFNGGVEKQYPGETSAGASPWPPTTSSPR